MATFAIGKSHEFLRNESNRIIIAWSILFIFFLISIAGLIFPQLETFSARFANRNYNNEGLIEIVEAVCWFMALIVFTVVFVKSIQNEPLILRRLWYLFFVVFCFVALGEETSWGQHIFGFDTPESIKAINSQSELNVHNLALGQIIGLEKDSPIYEYVHNFTTILNPIFYLICGLIWVVLPLAKIKGISTNWRLFSAVPIPAKGTIIFCGINILAYLIIDKLFFDIGEVFELCFALTAIMAALDLFFDKDAKFGLA